MLRNPTGLSYAVVSLLGAVIVLDALAILLSFQSRSTPGARFANDGELDPSLLSAALLSSLQLTALLATAIVFVLWFHRLRKNAEVWAPDLQSRGAGWAIGGWFIPIANLWIPRGIAADIWRSSRPEPYAADGTRELTLLNGWWTLWVADVVLDRVVSVKDRSAETVEEYLAVNDWYIASYAVDIVAAVLAILFVRRLTSMQQAKANGMIPATQ